MNVVAVPRLGFLIPQQLNVLKRPRIRQKQPLNAKKQHVAQNNQLATTPLKVVRGGHLPSKCSAKAWSRRTRIHDGLMLIDHLSWPILCINSQILRGRVVLIARFQHHCRFVFKNIPTIRKTYNSRGVITD